MAYRYIKQKDLKNFLNGRNYTSISITGSVKGMKKLYGWDKAIEIVRSVNNYFAMWS